MEDRRIWDKAVEIIEDLPDLERSENGAISRLNPGFLVSSIPQKRALEQVGLPVAVFDANGQRVLGPDCMPSQLDTQAGQAGWGTRGMGNMLLMWHSVLMDGESCQLCVALEAKHLQAFNPETVLLTPSEFAGLVSLTAGLSLREMAERDGVSYNTRRRQMETVLQKLGVHSQAAALRLIFSTVIKRVLTALSISDRKESGIQSLVDLYGDDARFHRIHLGGGPPLRVVEYGDPAGRPVLLFHPLLFPTGCSRQAMQNAHRIGLRVISPLRPGFYDSPNWARHPKLSEIASEWSQRVDALLQFINLQSVDVASVAFSAPWATDFARRFPSRIKSLIFASAPQPSAIFQQKKTASFIHSIAAIVSSSPWLSEPMVRLHAMRVHDRKSAVSGFRKTFSASEDDLAEISKLAADGSTFDTVAATLREGTKGVASDLRMAMQPWDT